MFFSSCQRPSFIPIQNHRQNSSSICSNFYVFWQQTGRKINGLTFNQKNVLAYLVPIFALLLLLFFVLNYVNRLVLRSLFHHLSTKNWSFFFILQLSFPCQ
jgi:hypothetical protein